RHQLIDAAAKQAESLQGFGHTQVGEVVDLSVLFAWRHCRDELLLNVEHELIQRSLGDGELTAHRPGSSEICSPAFGGSSADVAEHQIGRQESAVLAVAMKDLSPLGHNRLIRNVQIGS